jgi:hypothetical protein
VLGEELGQAVDQVHLDHLPQRHHGRLSGVVAGTG